MKALINIYKLILDKERRKITRDTKLFHDKLFTKKEKRKNYFKTFPAFLILRLKSKKANLYLMKPKIIQVLDPSLQNSKM
jgi:hypothetical protein